MWVFWASLPGWMCSSLMPCPEPIGAALMNSGSLPRRRRVAPPVFVQRLDHPQKRQAGIDRDPQRIAVEIVVDTDAAEAPPGPQCIGHKVRRLGLGVMAWPGVARNSQVRSGQRRCPDATG